MYGSYARHWLLSLLVNSVFIQERYDGIGCESAFREAFYSDDTLLDQNLYSDAKASVNMHWLLNFHCIQPGVLFRQKVCSN